MFFGIFRAKMMKFGSKIFFTTGLYNSLGTSVGPSWDLSASFPQVVVINLLTPSDPYFWHISRENDKIMTDIFFHESAGLVI